MYAVIRSFPQMQNVEEARRLAETGHAPILKQQPGFRAYYIIKLEGVSKRNLDIVRDAMLAETEDVADHATGQRVRVEGLRICGKTGTAERNERRADGQKKNTVWFISYAPYERPQWAVVVMVEDGQSGGSTCAPIARDVYTELLKMNRTATSNTLANTR